MNLLPACADLWPHKDEIEIQTWDSLNKIRNHLAILREAITGSHAGQSGADQHSDLDVLLVTRDLNAVRQVGKWVPQEWNLLICAFHLTHYCTVLLDDLENST